MSLQRNIRLLQWFNFFVDFRPQLPILVIYLARETGSYTLGMTVLSLTMLSAAVFELPTGILSDMTGRRRTMMMGSLAGALGALFTAWGGSFWLLSLGSICTGIALAFFSGNNNAFLHDTLRQQGREREFAHFLGITSALFQVGLGISALLGGILAQHALSWAMWAGVVPQVCCMVTAFFMIEPRKFDQSSGNVFEHLGIAIGQFRRNARLRALSIASVLDFGVGQSQFVFISAFFSLLIPPWAIGVARMLSHACAAWSYWFAGRIIKKWEKFRVLLGSKIISSTIAIGAYILQTAASPFIFSGLSLMFGVKRVSEDTLLQEEFTDEQRATMGSLNQFGGSIVFAISSFLFGYLADTAGIQLTLIISEVVLLAGTVFYWKAFRHPSSR